VSYVLSFIYKDDEFLAFCNGERLPAVEELRCVVRVKDL